jgi:uncharacterized membrane protein
LPKLSDEGELEMNERPSLLEANLKPGVTSSYANMWQALKRNFPQLLLVLMITIIWAATGNIWELAEMPSPLMDFGVLGIAYVAGSVILVSFPLSYGVSFACLKAVRNEKLQLTDIFEGFRRYVDSVLSGLFVIVFVSIGLILLIVPGICIGCRLAFTPFLVVDRKMHPVDAIKECWRMTRGYGWKIFLIGLIAFFSNFIISLLLLFSIGATWDTVAGVTIQTIGGATMNMLIWFTLASLYNAVSRLSAMPTLVQSTPSARPTETLSA